SDRLPLFIPAQNRLVPSGVHGQRWKSIPPPTLSKRITSAPSWASVIPPSGAATNADPSTTRSPSNGPTPPEPEPDDPAIPPSFPTDTRPAQRTEGAGRRLSDPAGRRHGAVATVELVPARPTGQPAEDIGSPAD